MRIPIDTGAVKFSAPGPAEPVLDFETRAPKLDEHGVPIFSVPKFPFAIDSSLDQRVRKYWPPPSSTRIGRQSQPPNHGPSPSKAQSRISQQLTQVDKRHPKLRAEFDFLEIFLFGFADSGALHIEGTFALAN
jgi:hypothetical protein